MNSISKAVETIVYRSDIAFFSMQKGVLNLSAYAKQIQKQVQNECKKPIRSTSSIIMALSRMQAKLGKNKISMPEISVTSVTIKRGLSELAVVKSPPAFRFIQKLLAAKDGEPQILLMNYGMGQINLIVQNMGPAKIKKLFAPYSPSAIVPNLVSITLGIPEEHVMIPNIFYALLSRMAVREINIIEITTAKLELTLIIEERVLPKVYEALSDILERKEDLFT